MVTIIINFRERNFRISLFAGDKKIDEVEESNASRNLIDRMDALLAKNNLTKQIEKIGFMVGPGSFTSSRIICAICAGIKMYRSDVLFIPIRLDQGIRCLYPDASIIAECNTTLYHLYHNGEWELRSVQDIQQMYFANLIQVGGQKVKCQAAREIAEIDLTNCMFEFCKSVSSQGEIKPFYGMEI